VRSAPTPARPAERDSTVSPDAAKKKDATPEPEKLSKKSPVKGLAKRKPR
jgi:hypothetical protein